MASNQPVNKSDNSKVGVGLVIGGLVLLIALAAALVSGVFTNNAPLPIGKPTPTASPCTSVTCRPTPTVPKSTPAPGTTVAPRPTATEAVKPPTEVPTAPPPVPSEQPTAPEPAVTATVPVATAVPTAPQPVPTQ